MARKRVMRLNESKMDLLIEECINSILSEYGYEDGQHGNNGIYYLPWFMWANIRNGYTTIEMANWFVQFDGIVDANYDNRGFLILIAQEDGIINVLKYLDCLGNDYDDYYDLCEYLGVEPETYQQLAELLKKRH